MNSIIHQVNVLTAHPFSFFSLEEEFKSSQTKLEDPTLLDEEIDFQKELFAKLKFQYLEQETRDKFLRRISRGDGDFVTRQDVTNIENETINRKKELKQLKTELNNNVNDLETISNEVMTYYSQFEERLAKLKSTISKVEQSNTKTNEMMNSHPEVKELVDHLMEQSNLNLDSIHSNITTRYADKDQQFDVLLGSVDQTRRAVGQKNGNLREASSKLEKLQMSMRELTPKDFLSQSQLFAKWCNEMNSFLQHFTEVESIQLAIEPQEEGTYQYKLMCKPKNTTGFTLCFGKDLDLQQYSGIEQTHVLHMLNTKYYSTDAFIDDVSKLIDNKFR